MGKKMVFVDTRTVGESFGTVGILRSVGSGRIVAESSTTRPFQFTRAAADDARDLAYRRGYALRERDEE